MGSVQKVKCKRMPNVSTEAGRKQRGTAGLNPGAAERERPIVVEPTFNNVARKTHWTRVIAPSSDPGGSLKISKTTLDQGHLPY